MATRAGTSGNDFFRDPAAGETLPGQIFLTGESDIVFGREGDDTMIATNPNSNVFYGEDGNDSLVGGSGGGTVLSGGAGNDTLVAGAGSTSMIGSQGADSILGGSAADVAMGGSDADTMRGGGGNDSMSGESGADRIFGDDGNDSIDGGYDNDTITGGLGNDKITGDRGDDSLIGGLGNDSLDGGAFFDILTYAQDAAIQRVVVTVQSARVTKVVLVGGVAVQQTDLISGIESFVGTAGADRFVGWGQDEQFRGGAGNDTIDGGAGFDWARYDGATSGVVASLVTGVATDGEGGRDQLRLLAAMDNSIEALAGGVHADSLLGDNDDNWLRGNWGADTLDGGAGFDMVDYSGDQDFNADGFGVVVNLSDTAQAGVAARTARDAKGDTDQLSGFEAARGTGFRDHLIGSDARGEQFRGMQGADTIEGGLGNDASVHRSDSDADLDGFGVAVNLSARQVAVTGFGTAGNITLAAATARDGWGDTDTLISIESAHGSSARDILIGAARDIRLRLGEWIFSATDRSFLRGAEEADTLMGAHPDDGVVSDHRSDLAGIVARLDQGWVEDGWGYRDVLVNVSGVSGSMMDDLIVAGAGQSWMRGMAGNDTLQGGPGTANVASYNGTGATAGVVVNLAEGWAEDGFGGLDLLIDIDGVNGDGFGDLLIGNEASNVIFGGRGADTLDGGGGDDWAHYYALSVGVPATASVEGVLVNLGAGFGLDGDGTPGGGSQDVLISFENALGSHLGDTLIGSDGANWLIGMEGADLLDGGAEADTLQGGAGADTLAGGLGSDLLGSSGPSSGTPSYAPTQVVEAGGDYEGSPMLADVTGDGIPDIIRSGDLLIQDGLGGGAYAAARWINLAGYTDGVAIADVNGDGALDLVTTAADGGPLAVLLNDGAGEFTQAEWLDRAGARQALAGDLNGDGRADVVLLDPNASGIVVRFGEAGTAGLADAANVAAGLAADAGAILDWDGDGDRDVILVNGAAGTMAVLRNDGTGTLTALPSVPVLPGSAGSGSGRYTSLVVADLNGDGRPDVAGLTETGIVHWRMMAADGTPGTLGTVDLATTRMGREMIAADVDDDGRLDLLVNSLYDTVNIDTQAVLFRNLGGGQFAAPVVIAQEFAATPWAVGDADLDGRSDLLATYWGSGDIIFRRQLAPVRTPDEDGDDLLDGGAGADTMQGGAGNDTYVVDDAGDRVIELNGAGTDLVRSSVTHALAPEVENLLLTGADAIDGTGNALANQITGNGGANVLDGGAGADTMQGGAGNDTYLVDNANDRVTEVAGGGTDLVLSSVTYTLGSEVENLVLTGIAAINAAGNSLANHITGNGAANSINGGTGADTMQGGAGNDTYFVDNAGDRVIEGAWAGTDLVRSSITHTLAGQVENLILTGTAAINGTGNTLANQITGNTGANLLDGGAGADTMQGGAGNDTYVVDNASDRVIEAASAGTDLVRSSVTHTLSAEVENLTLTGSAAIDGTGNTLANQIVGNDAANALNGGGGADTLDGGGGDDTLSNIGATGGLLRGGDGNDHLTGLAGAADTLDGGNGSDVAFYAGATGAATIDLGAGIAFGPGLGTDVLIGVENVHGTHFADSILGTIGDGYVFGRGGNDTIRTLDGSDILIGGSGDDLLDGGEGSDTAEYRDDGFDPAGPGTRGVVVNLGATAIVVGTETVAPGTALDNWGHRDTLISIGVIRGSALADTLIGESGSNSLFGAAGDDRLDGGAGNDRLDGGLGNDTLIGGAGWDILEHRDVVAGYAATLTGDSGTITGSEIGTDLVSGFEEIRGGAGNDLVSVTSVPRSGLWFRGLGGADTLIGPSTPSNQLVADYDGTPGVVVANLATGVVQDGTGSVDRLVNVVHIGAGAGADSLVGSQRNDVFVGRAGNDTIDGASGSDQARYHFSPDGVVVDLAAGTAADGYGSTDLLISIEEVSGSNLGDTLTGTEGGNWLQPNAGNDLIRGLGGADWAGFSAWSINGRDAVQGVVVSLVTGRATDQWGDADTLEGIENVAGSGFGDTITGDGEQNTIRPGAGSDSIVGGGGSDRVDYTDSALPVATTTGAVVNLATGIAIDPWGGTDTLVSIERVTGTVFADTLTGDVGSNRFNGRGGDDSIVGGAGGDWVEYSNATAGVVVDLGAGTATDGEGGTDRLASVEHAIGSAQADELTSDGAALGISQLRGGRGDDTLRAGGDQVAAANFADQGEGMLVDLGAAIVTSVTLGTDVLVGIRGAFMFGVFDDTLIGTAGDDWLSPERGADSVVGGAGRDILFYADATAGIVADLGAGRATDHGGGQDSFAGIEGLVTIWTADSLRGSAGDDVFDPGAGADTVDAGDGQDTLDYGSTYGNSAAVFTSDATGSQSPIQGVSVDLAAGIAFDIGGARDIVLGFEAATGNTGADTLAGNAADNRLDGRFGNDLLLGLGGHDLLDGGAGADTMQGGAGNDTYVVDNANDRVTEVAGGGTDLVLSSVTYTLGSEVENLVLTGIAAINAAGNSLANHITGNGAANSINGGTGADTMQGGAGNDTYFVDNAGDRVIEGAWAGTDLVRSSITHTLAGQVENLILTGTAAINGTGNTLANQITGNTGANLLDGGAGADQLDGGAGNDTLRGGAGADSLTGGTEADRFALASVDDSGLTAATWDVILDFDRSQGDLIDLSLIDADASSPASNEPFAFIDTAAFSSIDATAQLRWAYDAVRGGVVVSGSVDTDDIAEFALFVRGVTSLQASDFVL